MDPRRPGEIAEGTLVAPPPLVHESVPPPRPGHAWIPGYWDWTNGRYAWVPGHWEPARIGCHWRRHRWIQREGRWHLEPGCWVIDERAGACEACGQER